MHFSKKDIVNTVIDATLFTVIHHSVTKQENGKRYTRKTDNFLHRSMEKMKAD